jgi:hypothetical protein
MTHITEGIRQLGAKLYPADAEKEDKDQLASK